MGGGEWSTSGNLTSTGIQSLDRFVCSESPYQLCYLDPRLAWVHYKYGRYGTNGK